MNRKNILLWFLRIIVLFALIFVFWNALDHFRPYLLGLISEFIIPESSENENTKNVIVSALLGTFSLAISTASTVFITKFVESLFTPIENVPKVLITCPQHKDQNLSGRRLRHDCDQRLCINVGNEQNPFRIVYAQVKNTGENVVLEVSINKQVIASVLERGESKKFFFIVHEPINNAPNVSNYEFMYSVRNDRSDIYVGKYRMTVDRSLSKATFCLRKKSKRSMLKNALSNL